MCFVHRLLRQGVLLLLLVYGVNAAAGFDKARRAFWNLAPGSLAAASAYLVSHSVAPDLLDDGRADAFEPLPERRFHQHLQQTMAYGDMPLFTHRPSLALSERSARKAGTGWLFSRGLGVTEAPPTDEQRLASLAQQTSRGPSGRRQTDLGLVAQKIRELELKEQRLGGQLEVLSRTTGEMAVAVEELLADTETLVKQQSEAASVITSYEQQFADLDYMTTVQQAKITDGHFIWRIPDFDQYMEKAVKEGVSIYSAPFYTSPYGYQLALRAYLNGNGEGEGEYLSIFIVIMKGTFDALLEWPFRHRVRFYLRDQSPDVKNRKHHGRGITPDGLGAFEQPVNDMNVGAGIPKFIPLSRLKPRVTGDQPDGESWFVFNNAMFLEAVVELDEPEPGLITVESPVESPTDGGMDDDY